MDLSSFLFGLETGIFIGALGLVGGAYIWLCVRDWLAERRYVREEAEIEQEDSNV